MALTAEQMMAEFLQALSATGTQQQQAMQVMSQTMAQAIASAAQENVLLVEEMQKLKGGRRWQAVG